MESDCTRSRHQPLWPRRYRGEAAGPAPRSVAIRYPDRATLGDALRRLVEADWPLEGASDHGVSEALRDPDGNNVEVVNHNR